MQNRLSSNAGPKVATFECDVTSKESVEKVVESICKSYGVPHMLWNNAGMILKRYEIILSMYCIE